jgi:hypothetical protein
MNVTPGKIATVVIVGGVLALMFWPETEAEKAERIAAGAPPDTSFFNMPTINNAVAGNSSTGAVITLRSGVGTRVL